MKFFEIGKIGKPHGLKGWMRTSLYIESETVLSHIEDVALRARDNKETTFKVEDCRIGGRFFFIKLSGVDSIEAAAELAGNIVLAPSTAFPELEDGEYYWQELIGFDVIAEDGSQLGKIERIFPTGSNDVFVCKGDKGEIFLPATTDVILKVEKESERMVVRIFEGLL